MKPKNHRRALFGDRLYLMRISKAIASANRARLRSESRQPQRRFPDQRYNKASLSKHTPKGQRYQADKLEALVGKSRADRGKFKIETDRLRRSADTRHRFFTQPDPPLLGSPQKRAHTRWSGDLSNGPYVRNGGRLQPTYRLLLVAHHSRDGVEVRYALCPPWDTLSDALRHARSCFGLPQVPLLDNFPVYHACALQAYAEQKR